MAKGHFGFGSATMTTHLLDANTSGPAVEICANFDCKTYDTNAHELIFSLNTTQSRMPIRFVSAAAIVSRSIGRLSGPTMVDSNFSLSRVFVCVFSSLVGLGRAQVVVGIIYSIDRSFRLSTGWTLNTLFWLCYYDFVYRHMFQSNGKNIPAGVCRPQRKSHNRFQSNAHNNGQANKVVFR